MCLYIHLFGFDAARIGSCMSIWLSAITTSVQIVSSTLRETKHSPYIPPRFLPSLSSMKCICDTDETGSFLRIPSFIFIKPPEPVEVSNQGLLANFRVDSSHSRSSHSSKLAINRTNALDISHRLCSAQASAIARHQVNHMLVGADSARWRRRSPGREPTRENSRMKLLGTSATQWAPPLVGPCLMGSPPQAPRVTLLQDRRTRTQVELRTLCAVPERLWPWTRVRMTGLS